MEKEIENIKKLIANADFKIAIEKLEKLKPRLKKNLHSEKYKEFETSLIRISSNHNTIKKKEINEELDSESVRIGFSKIAVSLVELIYSINTNSLLNKKRDFNSGLTRITPAEANQLTIEKLKHAQWMKIVGAGRQDYAEASDDNIMLNYYSELETKLKEVPKSKKPFTIRRIAPHILKSKFIEHLNRAYEIASKNNNIYNVILYGDLKLNSTYYIIKSDEGEQILFLTLHRYIPGTSMFDVTLSFFTYDKVIIREYDRHFEHFWETESREGRILMDLNDFHKFIPFDKDLYDKYGQVKNFIKRIPNDSVRMGHLRKEIEIMHRRLEGLNSCSMTYRHSEENRRITDCFLDYINDLEKGKSYKTVSVLNFWKTIYDYHKFLDFQNDALFKGAKICRIYFVNSNSIVEIDNLDGSLHNEVEFEKKIVRDNYLQWKKHKKNYCFKIIFSTIGRESTKNENFAIWSNDEIKYKVIFRINYGDFRAATELSFANFQDEDTHNNQSLVIGYEKNFEFTLNRANEQNKKLLNYYKSKEKNNVEDEILERQLKFLKNCDIDEVEEFLLEKCEDQTV